MKTAGLKILHVIPSVDPRQGGPSTVMRTLTRELARAGLEVHVATTYGNKREGSNTSKSQFSSKEEITYRYFSCQTRFYSFSWAMNQWLARHVKEYSLVHIHFIFSYPAAAAAFWSHRYRIPYIICPHGILNRWGLENRRSWLKKISLRWIESRILARAAAVHYATKLERQEAVQLGAVGKAVIIPHALDKSFMDEHPSGGSLCTPSAKWVNGKVFLFLSRFHPKKGMDLLLSAFARVKYRFPSSVLVLAGEGESNFMSHLQREARRLGIDPEVVWVGFLEGEEKRRAFTDANVFILPSYSENFGVAILEAMACGVPVIISDQVGIHPDVSQAEAGIVVKTNVDSLADAMTQLLEHPEMAKKMGENGRKLVEEKFTVEKVIPQVIALYEKVLALNGSRAS